MSDNENRVSSVECPACGSHDVTRVRIFEHKPCSCTRPMDVFESDDGFVCPDCGGRNETAFAEVGTLYRCSRCENRFDVPAGDVTAAESDRAGIASMVTEINGMNAINVDRSWSLSRVGSVFFVFVLLAAVIGGAIAYKPPEQRSDTVWRHYDSIAVFRDDGVQGYYKYDTFQQVNQIFLDENVPVTLSVIPRVGKAHEPITDQSGFCDHLTQLRTNHPNQFEIALYGYEHEKHTTVLGNPSEFAKVPYEKQKRRIERGTAIVSQCAGTQPTTFVPSMDTYGPVTIRALAAQDFTAVSSSDWFTQSQFGTEHHFERKGVVTVPSDDGMIKQWQPNVVWYSQEKLENHFDRVNQNHGIYVLRFDYSTLDDETHRKVLRHLIDHMKSKDVKFMTVGQLATHFEKGTIKKTDDGWKVREPRNPGVSRGPTVRTRVHGIWTQIARQFTVPDSFPGLLHAEARRSASLRRVS